jgi:phosphoribosyl 1,2-cyclic phosphate phosphodiesterase
MAKSLPIELTFLGSGTSAGVPMIGCKCEVCTSTDPRDKRTRASVVIRYGQTSVLVDATPELRLQCVANDINWIDSVVITHAHADHVMGIDDLRRFNAIRNGPLDVWMDEPTSSTVRTAFGYCFGPQKEVGVFRPQLVERRIEGPFKIGEMTWTPIPIYHGSATILGFRIGRLAYCTDASGIPDESWHLLEGLDVLVIDALQERKHPTHFTIGEALAVVERVKPRRTVFTHMSHGVLHASTAAQLPDSVELAIDGLRVQVGA